MALVSLIGAELAFGLHPLLDRADLTVQDGERIGLIGRNGTGKSSLLQAIAGNLALDEGDLKRRDGLRVALVEQEPVLPPASSLRESLALRGGFDRLRDERERWRAEVRLLEMLHRFGLDEGADPGSASGGERKRAALALAFATEPDLVLLDEPTNHLDIDGITRVEDLLLKGPSAIVITHDRAFLDRVATRIVELDRGLLRSFPGNFAAYETRKASELAAELGRLTGAPASAAALDAVARGGEGGGREVEVKIEMEEKEAGEERAGAGAGTGTGTGTGVGAGAADADIIINATPSGMHPLVGECPLPAGALREGAAVLDLVYNPAETRLLRLAKERGCTAIDGLEMLVQQGARGFSIWTGIAAPVGVMREAVRGGRGR